MEIYIVDSRDCDHYLVINRISGVVPVFFENEKQKQSMINFNFKSQIFISLLNFYTFAKLF
jgi:hypothetical protein